MVERVVRKFCSLLYKPAAFANLSYSQEGEDLLLQTLFEEYPKNYKGFYVDIGAHHPWRFSNTFSFYRNGWRGINVDATPGSMSAFRRHRKRDINLELGVAEEAGSMTFFCFNDPALNTFDRALAEERSKLEKYSIVNTIVVKVMPLAAILDQFLPAGTKIDFLSVDVEGLDMMILKSNNWKKYSPTFLLVEEVLDGPEQAGQIADYLSGLNYHLVAKTQRTLVLQRKGKS